MLFISPKKSYCNFSLPFHTFHIQKGKWQRNNLQCHELACINWQTFCSNSKSALHYIIKLRRSSNTSLIFLNLFCNLKSDWLLVPWPFCFSQFYPLKDTGFGKKINLTLFLKEFLACNGCFELFTKIKKVSRTNFWCTCSTWFFHESSPYLILYQL